MTKTTKTFGYRNHTQNGTEKVVGSLEATKAKVASLQVQYPGIQWEVLEITVAHHGVTVFLPGRGRAGNSFAAKRQSNSVAAVKVLEIV